MTLSNLASRPLAAVAIGFVGCLSCLTIALGAGCDSGAAAAVSGEGDFAMSATMDQDPPATGQRSMIITVKDDAGEAVSGASLLAVPDMPAMGHGSSEEPVVTETGDGVYTAFPVTFIMPGEWVIHVEATKGELSGQKDFSYTVH